MQAAGARRRRSPSHVAPSQVTPLTIQDFTKKQGAWVSSASLTIQDKSLTTRDMTCHMTHALWVYKPHFQKLYQPSHSLVMKRYFSALQRPAAPDPPVKRTKANPAAKQGNVSADTRGVTI